MDDFDGIERARIGKFGGSVLMGVGTAVADSPLTKFAAETAVLMGATA